MRETDDRPATGDSLLFEEFWLRKNAQHRDQPRRFTAYEIAREAFADGLRIGLLTRNVEEFRTGAVAGFFAGGLVAVVVTVIAMKVLF